MFESGPGGDFATYIGKRTGAVYRLDRGKVHYQRIPLEALLSPALQQEGSLAPVPQEIRCKLCGNIFSAAPVPIDGEETVEAYEL